MDNKSQLRLAWSYVAYTLAGRSQSTSKYNHEIQTWCLFSLAYFLDGFDGRPFTAYNTVERDTPKIAATFRIERIPVGSEL